jgi:SpoIID/LytB domain protein
MLKARQAVDCTPVQKSPMMVAHRTSENGSRGMRRTSCAMLIGVTLGASVGLGQQTPERVLRVGIAKPGGGYTVTTLPLETYVARVLAGEAARASKPPALEALAITIRTFALANSGRHRADGFDLCDQTHCQVLRAPTPATERAAQATAGRILVRNGSPASIYYSASCGGHTEIPSRVWPGAEDPPFLPSQEDDACQGAPAWTTEIDERDLLRALHAGGFTGDRLRDVRIASRNRSGRVARLKLDGLRPDEISGQDLRVVVGRTLGWQRIQSTAFELEKRGDAYRFAGHGAGHGVGMCVIGSARLAEREGVTAENILARYFPGLQISAGNLIATQSQPGRDQVATTARGQTRGLTPGLTPARGTGSSPTPAAKAPAAPTVLITLPDEDEGERDAIVKQTLRARDDLAKTLGVPAPPPVTLRFHPTTDDYEQATDRAWFTSGALVKGELHLLPLAILRERGVLDRTIRHELVHLMTDAVFERRPQWVREGAAIYFAAAKPTSGETRPRPGFRPEPRGSCPSDNELARPVSVGALTNAYTRARECFAKQIQSGKSWRDVR